MFKTASTTPNSDLCKSLSIPQLISKSDRMGLTLVKYLYSYLKVNISFSSSFNTNIFSVIILFTELQKYIINI